MSSTAAQAADSEIASSTRRDVENSPPIASCYAGRPDMIKPPTTHDDQASEGLSHLLVTPPSSGDPPTPPTRVIPAASPGAATAVDRTDTFSAVPPPACYSTCTGPPNDTRNGIPPERDAGHA